MLNIAIASDIARNTTRGYPLDESATAEDINGVHLGHGVLSDLIISTSFKDSAYISSLAVTDSLVSITISQAAGAILLGTFSRRNIKPYNSYTLSPLGGFIGAGMVVFGDDILTTENYVYLFDVTGGLIHPQAVVYTATPHITSIRSEGGAVAAAGDVLLEGTGGVEIVAFPGRVEVGLSESAYKQLWEYRGNNLKTINSINGVTPDGNGVLTLRFRGTKRTIIDFSEAENKAERENNYGDENIEPSPEDWFTYAPAPAGVYVESFIPGPGRDEVVVPYMVGEAPVVGISGGAFKNASGVVSVATGVSDIGPGAFFGCTSLTTITAPNLDVIQANTFHGCANLLGLGDIEPTEIGEMAFNGCASLISINLDQCTRIGAGAFTGCESITAISLIGIGVILDDTFNGCRSLKTLYIPDVTTIGNRSFKDCESLDEVIFSGYTTTLGSGAFSGCIGLTAVEGYSIATIGEGAFEQCIRLEHLNLPAIQTMGPGAFRGCVMLGEARLPELQEVPDGAFYGCTALVDAGLFGCSSVGDEAFMSCVSLKRVYLSTASSATVAIGDRAFNSCVSLLSDAASSYYFSVSSVGSYAFSGCTSILSFELRPQYGSGLPPTIGEMAFCGCTSLKFFNGLSYVKEMGVGAFRGCTSLAVTPLAIPNIVTIPDNAFRDCTSLTTVTLDSAEVIGDNAFDGCGQLTPYGIDEIVTYASVTHIGSYAFRGCVNIPKFNFPSVIFIGDGAFDGCRYTTMLSIPLVETIGAMPFVNCDKLTNLYLPNVTNIHYDSFLGLYQLEALNMESLETLPANPDRPVFRGLSRLRTLNINNVQELDQKHGVSHLIYIENLMINSVTDLSGVVEHLPKGSLKTIHMNGVTSLPQDAFRGCDRLEEVYSTGVTSIGDYAFYTCTRLSTVSLPNLEFTGMYALSGSSLLESISLPRLSTVSWGTFYSNINLVSVSIPSATALHNNAFWGCRGLLRLELGTTPPTIGSNVFHGKNDDLMVYVPHNAVGYGETLGGVPVVVMEE